MEKQFFDSVDEIDYLDGGVQFYECVLKVDVGPHKVGEKFRCISVMYDEGKMILYDKEGRKPIYEQGIALTLL